MVGEGNHQRDLIWAYDSVHFWVDVWEVMSEPSGPS